jgi:hypothetical protein
MTEETAAQQDGATDADSVTDGEGTDYEPDGEDAEYEPDGGDTDYEPDEDDTGEEDRRLFGDRRKKVTVFVGAELGLTRVQVAADRVGQFSLVERGAVNCVAAQTSGRDSGAGAGDIVVATDDSVLVGDGEDFAAVGFGPAATVGVDDTFAYAASPDGEVARLSLTAVDDDADGVTDEWEQVGSVDGPARFDGKYLAAADGVHRVGEALEFYGLSDVRDVTYDGRYAATADGLYRREEGWAKEYDGDVQAVQARGEAVHALASGELSGDRLLAREGGSWDAVDLPTDGPLVDLVYGLGAYVLAADGTLVVEADPEATSDGHAGWRSRALGVRDARRLAVQG